MYLNKSLHEYEQLENKYYLLQDECEKLRQLVMIVSDTQKTFNTIVDHLYKQGCASVNDAGQCLYRGPNGTKCAIGCLIPDDIYTKSMEGISLVFIGLKFDCLTTKYVCMEMRRVHDDSKNASHYDDYLNERIMKVAREYNLEFNPR